jgi:hypothetical protein
MRPAVTASLRSVAFSSLAPRERRAAHLSPTPVSSDGLSVNVAAGHGYIYPRIAPHLGGGWGVPGRKSTTGITSVCVGVVHPWIYVPRARRKYGRGGGLENPTDLLGPGGRGHPKLALAPR